MTIKSIMQTAGMVLAFPSILAIACAPVVSITDPAIALYCLLFGFVGAIAGMCATMAE